MACYRELTKKHPSFRERSETTDLIVQISLQPWEAFRPDGVILFSDILTPLPGLGIPFDIDESKGPVVENPVKCLDDVKRLHKLELDGLGFVAESLKLLREETAAPKGAGPPPSVLGFVGSPWTLATYVIEGKTTSTYTVIKSMAYSAPDVLDALLTHLAEGIADYCRFQIDAGAHQIQMFDSWGGQLPPHMWEKWSKPYLMQIIQSLRETHPDTPLTLYANGSGGLLERMATTGVDCMGLDWTIDMADGRKRVGDLAVQGNVDPAVLFASEEAVVEAVKTVCEKAGNKGHVLNLGHGVLVGTPEENVKLFFDTSKNM